MDGVPLVISYWSIVICHRFPPSSTIKMTTDHICVYPCSSVANRLLSAEVLQVFIRVNQRLLAVSSV